MNANDHDVAADLKKLHEVHYESGKSSTICVDWLDRNRVLTLGARQGSYPGMPRDLTFKVVVVREGHGVGPTEESTPDTTVTYHGSELQVPVR